jgi:hypothetical protein
MPKPQGRLKMTGDVHPPEVEWDMDPIEEPAPGATQEPRRAPARIMRQERAPRWTPWLIALGLAALAVRVLRA